LGEVYRWAACVRACVTSNSTPCRQDQKNHRASQSHSLCTHRPSQHPCMKDALIRKRARTRMYVPTGTKALARSHTHARTHARTHALYTYMWTCARAGLLQVSFPSPRHTHLVWLCSVALRCVALRCECRCETHRCSVGSTNPAVSRFSRISLTAAGIMMESVWVYSVWRRRAMAGWCEQAY
jgi:hypothetical protein